MARGLVITAVLVCGVTAVAQPMLIDGGVTDGPPVDAVPLDAGVADAAPSTDAAVIDARPTYVITAAPEKPVAPAPAIGWRGYLEGYLAASAYAANMAGGATFGRFSAGALIAYYPAGGAGAYRIRVGLVGYLSDYRVYYASEAGWGGELGIDQTMTPLLRLGVLLTVAKDSDTSTPLGNPVTPVFTSIGPRVYVGPHFTIGIDFFNFFDGDTNWTHNGILLGLGLLP